MGSWNRKSDWRPASARTPLVVRQRCRRLIHRACGANNRTPQSSPVAFCVVVIVVALSDSELPQSGRERANELAREVGFWPPCDDTDFPSPAITTDSEDLLNISLNKHGRVFFPAPRMNAWGRHFKCGPTKRRGLLVCSFPFFIFHVWSEYVTTLTLAVLNDGDSDSLSDIQCFSSITPSLREALPSIQESLAAPVIKKRERESKKKSWSELVNNAQSQLWLSSSFFNEISVEKLSNRADQSIATLSVSL